jgi:hypothetical protein
MIVSGVGVGDSNWLDRVQLGSLELIRGLYTVGKNSPRPLPHGGDRSNMEASAVMRVLSGSAPGNVSNGCPDSSHN